MSKNLKSITKFFKKGKALKNVQTYRNFPITKFPKARKFPKKIQNSQNISKFEIFKDFQTLKKFQKF